MFYCVRGVACCFEFVFLINSRYVCANQIVSCDLSETCDQNGGFIELTDSTISPSSTVGIESVRTRNGTRYREHLNGIVANSSQQKRKLHKNTPGLVQLVSVLFTYNRYLHSYLLNMYNKYNDPTI